VEVNVTAGSGGSAHSRTIVLCDDRGDLLDRWLAMPHADYDGPGGAISETAVHSTVPA
jgi:hypothetical protein